MGKPKRPPIDVSKAERDAKPANVLSASVAAKPTAEDAANRASVAFVERSVEKMRRIDANRLEHFFEGFSEAEIAGVVVAAAQGGDRFILGRLARECAYANSDGMDKAFGAVTALVLLGVHPADAEKIVSDATKESDHG